jgi:rhodanese-related sulfurtransferase
MASSDISTARFRRVDARELRARLSSGEPPLVLDVRRGEAFDEPPGIPTAVPFALDRDPLQLPDVVRDRPIAVYCL